MKKAMFPVLWVSALGLFPIFAIDPSTQPLSDITGQQKYRERSRILVDLNGDGAKDLLLSNPLTAGNSGVDWEVYLQREGDYHKIGNLWAHSKAVSFERPAGDVHAGVIARAWVYIRGGAGKGAFGYYLLKESSIDELKSLEIAPDLDNGGIGANIYTATFEKSPIPFELETSTTTEDGKVSWAATAK